ncbi:hypothetical protein BKA70DRAFT_1451120 [Coprinopsis sp. MPI-PUGE-AT-0042]|nr:hypothetical protein BKA70DRAFT_1451120 [Coprinopsis sp. MPI-PUGE-AT-0042]
MPTKRTSESKPKAEGANSSDKMATLLNEYEKALDDIESYTHCRQESIFVTRRLTRRIEEAEGAGKVEGANIAALKKCITSLAQKRSNAKGANTRRKKALLALVVTANDLDAEAASWKAMQESAEARAKASLKRLLTPTPETASPGKRICPQGREFQSGPPPPASPLNPLPPSPKCLAPTSPPPSPKCLAPGLPPTSPAATSENSPDLEGLVDSGINFEAGEENHRNLAGSSASKGGADLEPEDTKVDTTPRDSKAGAEPEDSKVVVEDMKVDAKPKDSKAGVEPEGVEAKKSQGDIRRKEGWKTCKKIQKAKVSATKGSDDKPVEVQAAASQEAEKVSYKKQVASSEAELANFISGGSLISNNTRSHAQKHQSFCPGLATVSRLLLLQGFILKNYLTQCHFHTLTEHGPNGKNDFNRDPGLKHEVSGVPYPTSKAVLAKQEVQEHLGHRQPRTVGVIAKDVTAPPLKNDGRYILHCSCDLEEVLLDFFLWKTSPLLTSHSKGHQEEYGSPLSPHQHLYQFVNLQTLHFCLDNHLLYDTRGHI